MVRYNETVKYVPRGRVEDWGGATVRRDVEEGGDEDAGGPQTKSAAHGGRASHNAVSTTACGARVEEGDDGKTRDAMPCAAERCPTRLSQIPTPRWRRPPRHRHRR